MVDQEVQQSIEEGHVHPTELHLLLDDKETEIDVSIDTRSITEAFDTFAFSVVVSEMMRKRHDYNVTRLPASDIRTLAPVITAILHNRDKTDNLYAEYLSDPATEPAPLNQEEFRAIATEAFALVDRPMVKAICASAAHDLESIIQGAATPARDIMRPPIWWRSRARRLYLKFVELENDDTKILPIPDTARILRERGVYKLPPDEIAIMSREFIAEGFLGLFKILIYHHMNKVADPVIDYAEHAERARRKARNRLAGIVLADILINQIPLVATGMLVYFGFRAIETRRKMDRAIASFQNYPITPPDLREHIGVSVSSSRSG